MYEPKRRRQLPYVAAVVFSVALVWALASTMRSDRPAPGRTGCVEVVVAVSHEKAALWSELAADFSRSGQTSDGRCATAKVTKKASGEAEEALARGWDEPTDGVRPDVWSPAAWTWAVLLRQHRSSRDLPNILPPAAPSIMQSPLVIAMPRPMAEALGWPDRPLGWSDILALARHPQGWGRVGHPEWGRFRLGKTNPHISTSGFHALVGTYFAATGTSHDLTLANVRSPKVLDFVRGVESTVVHYGETAGNFLRNLKLADERGAAMSYVSAIAIEEKQVWDYNTGGSSPEHRRPAMPLAAIYPKEGTLLADHPYIVLDAPWVDEAKQAAAAAFLLYLQDTPRQERFKNAGFRDGTGKGGSELSLSNGLIPAGPSIILRPPNPSVLELVQRSWADVRKRARVLLVIDVSGSMEGEKLALVKKAAVAALDGFAPDDEVGLWTFSTDYLSVVPIGPVAKRKQELVRRIEGLIAEGSTALYVTARASVQYMRDQFDYSRINAVVLLTDGRNEHPDRDLNALLQDLHSGSEEIRVRLFTVAFGQDADKKVLKSIAEATSAAAYDSSDPAAIHKVFREAISNF